MNEQIEREENRRLPKAIKQVSAVALLMLMAIPLANSASIPPPTPESVCDIAESSQSEWQSDGLGGYTAVITINQVNCRALLANRSGNEPDASVSAKATCTLVVHSDTRESHSGVNLLVWWSYTTTTSTTVTSDLTCSGTYQLTVTHYGGLGPRSATDTITKHQMVHSMGQLSIGSSGGCPYFDPMTPSCTSTHNVDATVQETGIKGVLDSVTPCVDFDWTDTSDVALLGGTQGSMSACADPVHVTRVGLDLLA